MMTLYGSKTAGRLFLVIVIVLLTISALVLISCTQTTTSATSGASSDMSSSSLNILTSSSKPERTFENSNNPVTTLLGGSDKTAVYISSDEASWSGEHQCDTFETMGVQKARGDINPPSVTMAVMSYDKYKETMNAIQAWIGDETVSCNGYDDPELNYLVIVDPLQGRTYADMKVHDCYFDNGTIILYAGSHSGGTTADDALVIAVIPTNLPAGTPIEYREVKTPTEYNRMVHPRMDKPIIYLYPENEEEVSVTLSNPEAITCSYPAYNNGWNVMASPDGTLKDLDSDRDLYALYYEADTNHHLAFTDGFVVCGQDSAAFLENKLTTLGLTDREAEEFIVYWLPILEANKYNFIHFLTADEIDQQIQLDITPTPDSVIRVCMAFEGLDTPIEIAEQQLETPVRDGFTVVEWGGIQL